LLAPDRLGTALEALHAAADADFRDSLGPRYGIVAPTALGVPMAALKAIARTLGRDHALAQALWESGIYEARLLASLVGDPAQVTPGLMDAWRAGFDNWGVCDTLCFNLFDKAADAPAMVAPWIALNAEFGRRAGLALLACLALHDRKLKDDWFREQLAMAQTAASDSRHLVKKSVSWALRSVAHRNATLHGEVVAMAERLAASDDRTARWIAADVLRDIRRPNVLKKIGL